MYYLYNKNNEKFSVNDDYDDYESDISDFEEHFTDGEDSENDDQSEMSEVSDDEDDNDEDIVAPYDLYSEEESTIAPSLQKDINKNVKNKVASGVENKGHTSSHSNGTWTENLNQTFSNSNQPTGSENVEDEGPIGVVTDDFNAAPYRGSGTADTSVGELYKSSNYLPKDDSKWQNMPVRVNNSDLIGASHRHIGVGTVGSSLRNANLQLRAEPPNPQNQVSPWMNTTIGPDLKRKPLI